MGNCFTCLKSSTSKENDIDPANNSSIKVDDSINPQQIISDRQQVDSRDRKETEELLAHNPMHLTTIDTSSASITPQVGGIKKSILLSNGTTQITSTTNSGN